MKSSLTAVLTCVLAFTAAAQHDMQKMGNVPLKAIALLAPAKDKTVKGVVTFTQSDNGVKVYAHLEGLTPGKHGFHIHEFGDCTAADLTSAGGHFNPTQSSHGAPADEMRHSGDLGNIVADEKGMAILEWVDPMMQLSGPNAIIGHAVIVHAKEDDLKTQPTGNAGAREACGVIGIAK
ncbi:MAG: superoxide dismutase family protein [Ignavibacteriales bacterium]|nr:superoxide dismutase family protein [Ignavibacteriales bacterium]